MVGVFAWKAGAGPRALCLHGSGSSGQNVMGLAESIPGFLIVAPDRPNYGRSAAAIPSSLETEVALLGELLEGGAHMFGQSYGGVLSLLIAARWPDSVRSLAVNEPPALQVAKDDPAVQALLRSLAALYPPRSTDTPKEWMDRWADAVGMGANPAPLSQEVERGVVAMMREQPPWEADIDLDALARAPFPKLVLSGGWHPAFEAVCDTLERRLNARRVTVPGDDHSLAGRDGSRVRALGEFWRATER